MGAEHCLLVHFKQAAKYGASEDEMFDAVMVGAMMAMTASQAVAYGSLRSSKRTRISNLNSMRVNRGTFFICRPILCRTKPPKVGHSAMLAIVR